MTKFVVQTVRREQPQQSFFAQFGGTCGAAWQFFALKPFVGTPIAITLRQVFKPYRSQAS
jgi:hypothetical protein